MGLDGAIVEIAHCIGGDGFERLDLIDLREDGLGGSI